MEDSKIYNFRSKDGPGVYPKLTLGNDNAKPRAFKEHANWGTSPNLPKVL